MKKLIIRVIDFFYFRPFTKIPYDTFRYIACGGANTLFDALLYMLFFHLVFQKEDIYIGFLGIGGIDVMTAKIASLLVVYPITFFTGFWLMNNIALSGSPVKTGSKMFRYFSVGVFNLLLNYMGINFFVDCLNFYPTPTKLLMSFICAVISYVLQRCFSFRNYTRYKK